MPSDSSRVGVDELLAAARNARDDLRAWRRTRLGLRGWLLYVLAVPLPFAAVVALAGGRLAAALAAGAGFALIGVGAWLNRRGMLEELVAPERRFTRTLRPPHKYLAALAVGLGTTVAAYGAAGQGLLVSLTFGALAVLGFHLTYRLPAPRAALGLTRREVTDKTLQKALAQAEGRILAIEKTALSVGNAELEQRLARIASKGRAVLEIIVERPVERFRARKFLNVYLEGAERVAGRYVKTHRLARGRALEQNFRNALIEIEQVFDRQLARLAEHDVFDLDVQIEVLRKQLEREGIT
jgi:5-bromo-4-chloroindolyl phosphate hydrolysis protein